MKLICKKCSNNETFIAKYLYACEVDNEGKKIESEEMVDEPEYQCVKCGSYDIRFIFDKSI